MKITAKQGKWKQNDIEDLIVPFVEGETIPKGLPKLAEHLLKDAVAKKEFQGKARQMLTLTVPQSKGKGLRRVHCIGVGKKNALKANDFGELTGAAMRSAQAAKSSQVGFWFRDILQDSFDEVEHLAEILATYAVMAGYEYSEYLKKKKTRVKQMTVYIENKKEVDPVKEGLRIGAVIGRITNDSRDLANHPSNHLTPKELARFAKESAKGVENFSVRVLGEKEMAKLGMGGVLGVSQGSAQEAQFIIMEYWGADKKEAPRMFVGKGITFDTGGISIKPSSSMHEMKYDMCGGISALAIARIAAELQLPMNVVSLIPASENMPGHEAYKPGDVLRAMDGSTIEVLNTDAEGRLLLADALVYARDYKPASVIDLATLTGACAVALHDSAAGMFTKNDDLAESLSQASSRSGDSLWRLPLPARYRELLKSQVADIANIASTPYGGAITAAMFLNHFVANKYPWVHLDIAGVAWANSGTKYLAPGSTGAGIRACVEWLRAQSANSKSE